MEGSETQVQNGKRKGKGSKQNDGVGTSGLSGGGLSVVQSALASVAGSVQTLQSERTRLTAQRAEIETQMQSQMEQIDAQIEQVDEGLTQLGVATAAPTQTKGRGRGRPKGSKNKVKNKGGRKAGRPKGSKRASNEGNLPEAIAKLFDHAGPLGLPDIIAKVQSAPINYKTTSGDGFRSIVQQAFTKHMVHFGRDGTAKTDKDGNVVSKSGLPGMFVRLSRGVYGNFQKGDTEEKVEKRGAAALAAEAKTT